MCAPASWWDDTHWNFDTGTMKASTIAESDRYFHALATAFVRGRLGDADASIADGLRAGLRLHKFKRDSQLARVQRVIGILRGIRPVNCPPRQEPFLKQCCIAGNCHEATPMTFSALPVAKPVVSCQR